MTATNIRTAGGLRPTGINWTHRDAISNLGFVHERMSTGDPRCNTYFVPGDQFGKTTTLRVVIVPGDETTICVFSQDRPEMLYKVRFSAHTPGTVVNQAVAAAMQTLEESTE